MKKPTSSSILEYLKHKRAYHQERVGAYILRQQKDGYSDEINEWQEYHQMEYNRLNDEIREIENARPT